MSLFTRASAPELYSMGIRRVAVRNWKMFPWSYMDYFTVLTSTKQDEKDKLIHGIRTVPQITEAQDYPEGQLTDGGSYTYTHLEYAIIIPVGNVAREDNLYRTIEKIPAMMSDAVANTVEIIDAGFLNNITTLTGADGVAFVATTHPGLNGTWANRPTVYADLGYTTLQDALVARLNMASYEGIPIVQARKPLLIYHPDNDPTVAKLMGSEKEPFSADNTINYLRGKVEPKMLPWLDDSDAWGLVEQPNPDGLIHFWRVKPSFKQFVDNRNDNVAIRVRTRFSRGCTDPRMGVTWWSTGG